MIGLFLALLELIRQGRVRASQDRPFGTIYLYLLDVGETGGEAPAGGMADQVESRGGPVDDGDTTPEPAAATHGNVVDQDHPSEQEA